jgi:hypothetical protein
MENDIRKTCKAAGILTAVTVMCVMISQIYLGANFDWEGKTFGVVFMMYQAGLPHIRVIWSVFAFGVILMVPLSVLYYSCFRNRKNILLRIGTCFGIVAGFSYALGIMRWVMLADVLSKKYALAASASPERRLYEEVFEAFNVFAGNGFGETIAPLCHAAFLVCLGIVILSDRSIRNSITRLFAVSQIALGIGIGLRPAEYIGLPAVGKLSDSIMAFWAVVFFLYGIYMIFSRDIFSGQEKSGI